MITVWRNTTFSYMQDKLRVLPRGVPVVDLGAGGGFFKPLTDRFATICVDIQKRSGIDVVADFSKPFPFRDGQFAGAIAANVLEHLADPLFFLKETHRILQSGGILVGCVPYFTKLHQEPIDFHRYTCYGLRAHFEKTGFREIEIKNIGSVSDMLYIAYKIAFSRPLSFKQKIIKRLFAKVLRYFPQESRTCPIGYCFMGVK